MKKLFNILLVLVMLLTIVPVSAATGTGKITITKAASQNDVSYKLYRLFDVEYDAKNETQVYFLNEKYASLFEEGGVLAEYVELSTTPTNEGRTYVKSVTFSEDDAKVFTAAALEAVKNMAADAEAFIEAEDPTTDVKDLPFGYWLVDSSLGSVVSIDTTKPNASIKDKNEDSVPVKTVKEVSIEIGELAHYKVVYEIKPGAQNLVFTDVMTKGLTFTEDYTVKILKSADDTEGTEIEVGDKTYTYTKGTLKANGTDVQFTLTFDNSFATANVGNFIEVSYTALTNEEAATVDTVNNTASYNYGDNNKIDSNEVVTLLYRFGIDKMSDEVYTNDVYTSGYNPRLAGAKFKLYDAKTDGNEIQVIKDGKYYRPILTGEEAEEIVTDGNGFAEIRGLAEGTYYVEETEAPEGYVKLTQRVQVTIVEQDADEDIAITDLSPVVNTKKVVLPSTGGMGTVLFITIGSLMVLGFGVLLVTKFRMSKELA